jgi:hypothetical protein
MEDFLLIPSDFYSYNQRVILIINAKGNWLIEKRFRTTLGLRYRPHVALLDSHNERISGLRRQIERLFHRHKEAANWALDALVGRILLTVAFALLSVDFGVQIEDSLG